MVTVIFEGEYSDRHSIGAVNLPEGMELREMLQRFEAEFPPPPEYRCSVKAHKEWRKTAVPRMMAAGLNGGLIRSGEPVFLSYNHCFVEWLGKQPGCTPVEWDEWNLEERWD